MGLVLVLAATYFLPDAPAAPPDDAQAVRLERALAAIRSGEDADVGVREIALLGEVALPAVVARLNEAGGGERLLLLAAVSRMERAAPLLEQARGDPHPAVRAWADPVRPRPKPDLRTLAGRYLDVLAFAEEKLRLDADADLAAIDGGAGSRARGRPLETLRRSRDRMQDRAVAREIQAERRRVARLFAAEGGAALRAGELRPDLGDPVFVAYLALLREEGTPFYYAVSALVDLGNAAAPAFEALLARPHHDPRITLRVLRSVRPDGGLGLYDGFDGYAPEVQRALVALAPTMLPAGDQLPLFARAALSEHASVRAAALDELLAMPAAGAAAARELLDPTRFGENDFDRAARILARAGELEALERFAVVAVPDDNQEISKELEALRRSARAALRTAEGPDAEARGARYCASEARDVRLLGTDLLRDLDALLARVREEPGSDLAEHAAQRALELHGSQAAERVLDALAARSPAGAPRRVPGRLILALRDAGRADLLIELARTGDPATRTYALRRLADERSLDPRLEAALLALDDAAPEDLRSLEREVLVPLGTPEAVRRVLAAPMDDVVPMLARRAELGNPIPFDVPLLPLVAEADAVRLRDLAIVAERLPNPEPGLFLALMQAWDRLEPGERDPRDVDSSALLQRIRLLDVLARSRDTVSAKAFLDQLVEGRQRDPLLVPGICKAAARLLPAAETGRLLPLVGEFARQERAGPDREPPPWDAYRNQLLTSGITALGCARVEAALPALCDLILEPRLHAPAFDWAYQSPAPALALNALRFFPSDAVDTAFRAAVARAETDGRLAALHPVSLLDLAEYARGGRDRGRWAAEVSLALTEVLDRLPWESDDAGVLRMLSLGQLNRAADAADAGYADAARKRARGCTESDGFWTPERVEGRARLYAATARGDADLVAAEATRTGDPLLLNTIAWLLHFDLSATERAAPVAEEAVRRTAGLYHAYRDTLAAIRVAQGRPAEALDLVDPQRLLPVKRLRQSGYYMVFSAQARVLLGDAFHARHDLELGLTEDRRLLPWARNLPEFAPVADLFPQLDEEFLDELFAVPFE